MRENPTVDARSESRRLYADIIVPRHLARSFTYLVPPRLKPLLRIGHCVLVPFGRSRVQGAVVSLTETLPSHLDGDRLKEIGSIVREDSLVEIPTRLLDLAKQVSDYYVAPLGQCLRLVVPPPVGRLSLGRRLSLTELGRGVLAAGQQSDEAALLLRLSRRPAGIKRATLVRRNPSRQQALLDTLLEKGWIVENVQGPLTDRSRLHDPIWLSSSDQHPAAGSSFSGGSSRQFELEERLVIALNNRPPAKVFLQAPRVDRLALLHRAIGHVLAEGRSALVIVGETDRAQWLARMLTERGHFVAGCFHSGLSDDQRAAIWRQAGGYESQVVVGTRSAVFLPFLSLGMIWIERDEDPALKEPQEPRYHAREVAWMRARGEGILLIQSSSHPFLETIRHGNGDGTLLKAESPVARQPRIEVVDLRPLGKGTVLSPGLIEATREAIDRKAGVLLFLNRKSYATALVCRDCGQVPRCELCRVALAYSRRAGRLRCSYCGASTALPGTCVVCAGHRLQLIGEGTERIEEEVARLFPNAAIVRIDGDTMRKPLQAAARWNSIKAGQWDVLIGTQLLLRDYLVPPFGLVGAVQTDTSLSLPDFRAAERTYHLLREMVGLARPADNGGRVIIQSYHPSHHAIQAVVRQDESIFTSEELFHRATLGYPPVVHLISLQVSGAYEKVVEKAALAWSKRLQAVPASSLHEFVVLGPVPPLVPKARGRYRRQILVKSLARERGLEIVRESICQLERMYPARAVKFYVDVDPVEMW